jgi:menaquinone-specific isochorismate synthase
VDIETRSAQAPAWLDVAARARLHSGADKAVRRARRRREPTLVSVTVPVAADLDVSACALAARRTGERFFCLEQPDRGRFALAAIGSAAEVAARGGTRFSDALARTRELARGAVVDDPGADPLGPAHGGPVWVGGFAFADEGGAQPEWSHLAPALLVLPELAFARKDDQVRLTLTAIVDGDEAPVAVVERLERRASELRPAGMPLADPDPVVEATIAGAAPASHYEGAVARAVERIGAGDVSKIVLAREVRVHAPADIDPAPVYDALRAIFPACYSYLVGRGDQSFLGASPELLVRREGHRAQTVALAGTTRRSADPSVDDHLGERLLRSPKEREEQAIVARRIQRSLAPVSVWVAAGDEPALVKVHNVQHLATPIRAQLAHPLSTIELVGLLHPTPAVGGEPRARALELIPELEGLDRGWYAGAVGWTGLSEDGEFCVAIRCALLHQRVAHLYAGCGIVRDSDPASELAETEVKLQALLPLLA